MRGGVVWGKLLPIVPQCVQCRLQHGNGVVLCCIDVPNQLPIVLQQHHLLLLRQRLLGITVHQSLQDELRFMRHGIWGVHGLFDRFHRLKLHHDSERGDVHSE